MAVKNKESIYTFYLALYIKIKVFNLFKRDLIIYNKAVRCKVGKAFSRKSVTVIETIYADGHIIPPLIIFKGKTY